MAYATTGNDQTVGELAARLFGVGAGARWAARPPSSSSLSTRS